MTPFSDVIRGDGNAPPMEVAICGLHGVLFIEKQKKSPTIVCVLNVSQYMD
mgnify:CR=1 FL=1